MHADAVLIIKPHIDFKTMLGLSSEALGYKPTEKSDAGLLDVSDTERFIMPWPRYVTKRVLRV